MIVSREELNSIISQLQGKIIWFLVVAAIPLTFSGGIAVTIIRGDIKDSRTIAHSENVSLKRYVDSLHHDNETDIRDIRTIISNLPQPKTTIIKQTLPLRGNNSTLYNMRYIDGRLAFIPVK